MRLVGLTGGIASGKSTVAKMIQDRGIPVVDADVIARDALNKGTDGYNNVVKVFGESILGPDGEVDRAKLGSMIFADEEQRKKLNAAMHGSITRALIREVFKHWLAGTKVLVLDVPLLYENGMDKYMSDVVVVWVDRETQEARLVARNGLSSEEANNRINSQMSLDAKKERADLLIDNNGTLDETAKEVRGLVITITEPLTWKEALLSRDFVAGLLALACVSGVWKLWASRQSVS